MAAVSITPADFQVASTSARGNPVQAGEAFATMTPVYLDEDTGKYMIASNATQAASQIAGFAASKSTGDGDWFLLIDTVGATVTVGGTLVAGDTYYLGAAGAIIPQADLATNNWVTVLFVATSTTDGKLLIDALDIQAA